MMDQQELRAFKKITLIVTLVVSFCSAFIMSAVNVALPVMGEQLGMTSVMLGWVPISSLLVSAVLMVPAGRLGDIYGRNRIFILGLVFQLFSTVLCGLATSGSFVIFTRLLQGVGIATIFGTMAAILTSIFPIDERGKALGISVAGTYAGLAFGPFLGGVLTQYLGWRSIFFFGAFVTAVILGFASSKLKGEQSEAAGEKFDVIGTLLFVLSLGLIIYGFTILPGLLGFILVVIGIILLGAFVRLEGKTKSPILNVGILGRNAVFVFSNIATMVQYSASFALTFLLSLYLQYIKGCSPQQAGMILLINPLVMAVFAPIAGRLSDRFQPQIIAAVGMSFSCISMALLSFLDGKSHLDYIITLLALAGLSAGIFSTPNTNAVMSAVEKRFLGVAAGTQGTTRALGMVLSMGIVMILFTVLMGGEKITPQHYQAFLACMKTGFIIFAALSFIGIFCQLAGRRRETSQAGNAGIMK